MSYPKELNLNKRYRIKLIQKAKQDIKLQQTLLEKSRRDILFFINTFGFTYNPRLSKPVIPFITYSFQDSFLDDISKQIENGTDCFVEKSRDMGFSWMTVALQVWGFIKGWNSLYGSYKQDYVDEQGNMDSHFERIRFFTSKLPKWFLPSDLVEKYMNISSKELQTEISGDVGENFGTGGRRKFVILDEFALWQYDSTAFRKTKDVTNCRIFGGTPNGRMNLYGKVMTDHRDYRHLQFKKYTLHWTKHPLKTQEWYEQEKMKRTKIDMAKELDISYEDSVTGAVYPEFNVHSKLDKVTFNPEWPLYTSWDFGRDMTAIIWIQKDYHTNTNYVVDAFQKTNCDIDFFVPFMTGKVDTRFGYTESELAIINKHQDWYKNYAGHFGDPYSLDQRNSLSINTIRKQLNIAGIDVHCKRDTTVHDRIQKTALALRRLTIDKDLVDFIQAIQQSRYPEVRETAQPTSEKILPIHNYLSHFRTACEYWFDNEPEQIQQDNKPVTYTQTTQQPEFKTDLEEYFQDEKERVRYL